MEDDETLKKDEKVIAIEADKDNKKEPISCIKPNGQGWFFRRW